MTPKVFLFDADGVVLHKDKRFTTLLAEENLISSIDATAPFFAGVFQDCIVGKADAKQELIKVIDDWGWQGSVDELMNFWLSTDNQPNQAVVNYIKHLKRTGVPHYLATNQEKYRGEYIRSLIGHLFDDCFVSADLGYVKKNPEFFAIVYDKVRHLADDNPANVLLIDDDKENVQIAKDFGFSTIHFQSPSDLPPTPQ